MSTLSNTFSKRITSALIHFLVYSNLWVAISAGSITIGVFIINNLSISPSVILLNICLTFLSYNYIYWIGNRSNSEKMDSDRKRWMDNNKWIPPALFFVAIIYIATKIYLLSLTQWFILLILSVLSIFYIIPSRSDRGIRWLPGLKMQIIALSWSLLIVPFSFDKLLTTHTLFIQGAIVFFFVMALAIPFDLRDIQNDSKSLRTLPQVFGVKSSVRLSEMLLFMIGIIIFVYTPSLTEKSIHLFFTLTSITLIHYSIHQKPMYYIFWIEGIPFFWISGILIVQ